MPGLHDVGSVAWPSQLLVCTTATHAFTHSAVSIRVIVIGLSMVSLACSLHKLEICCKCACAEARLRSEHARVLRLRMLCMHECSSRFA